jgi:hypothetical protein
VTDVEHSVTVIAEVDGVEVHRVTRTLKATGAIGVDISVQRQFDPVVAVVGVMRQEADYLQASLRRKAARNDYTVIDAAPEGPR